MLTLFKNKLKELIRAPYGFYALLLLIGMAAYGLHLNNIGFYWDDWPWVWSLHVNGAQGLLKIDEYHRPLSGIVLYLGGLFAGEKPLLWQSYTLLLRLLGTLTLVWMLNLLWDDKHQYTRVIGLLFFLYPGFNEQFLSVNNSRHIFPLITFFLSFGFMLKSLQTTARIRQYTLLALAFSLISMLTTEYYYGLELSRVVLIWLILRRTEKSARASFISALKIWLPYALLLIALFGWRYSVSTRRNYSVTIFDQLNVEGIRLLAQNALLDLRTATVDAWQSIFNWQIINEYGKRIRLYYAVITGLVSTATLLYLSAQKANADQPGWRAEAWIFGVSALVMSPLPFWVTGLDPKLGFPNDRLLLPSMLGASLLLVALIDLLKPRALQIVLFSLMIGFSAGSQYQNGLFYRNAWASTTGFFQQLSTRAPNLQAKTTILSNQLPGRSTDNSLIAPLNWIYAPDFENGPIPLQILYVDLRFGRNETVIDETLFLSKPYMRYIFEGSLENVITVFYEPPACLQLVDPENLLRNIPEPLNAAVLYSSPELIFENAELTASLPAFFGSSDDSSDWCYYFEKADLARQTEDWAKIAELGDIAFGAGKSPNHPSERIPFIEGYAYNGEWQKAADVTLGAVRQSNSYCRVWAALKDKTPQTPEKENALKRISEALKCDF